MQPGALALALVFAAATVTGCAIQSSITKTDESSVTVAVSYETFGDAKPSDEDITTTALATAQEGCERYRRVAEFSSLHVVQAANLHNGGITKLEMVYACVEPTQSTTVYRTE